MLELRSVEFSYPLPSPMSFTFEMFLKKGEVAVLEGRSGVGKSTLLNLIAGFLTPHQGMILWQGQNLITTPPSDRPLSMIFQDGNLFNHLTCRMNVALGLRPSLILSEEEWQAVRLAMDELGILSLEHRRPEDVSGGQQQRIVLARALIRAQWQNRQLLLFDEPFSALDNDTRIGCIDAVKHIVAMNNMTVLMVSHNSDDAKRLNARIIKL